MRRVHVVVRGRVQGVGFRYHSRVFARRVGVAGWVRNLSDGPVDAEVEGTSDLVDEMLAWMAHGPPDARVESIETADVEPTGEDGFEIRETV